MKKVMILGATCNFGQEIRKYLLANTDYYLTLACRHASRLKVDPKREQTVNVDATDVQTLKNVVAGQDIVFSACMARLRFSPPHGACPAGTAWPRAGGSPPAHPSRS